MNEPEKYDGKWKRLVTKTTECVILLHEMSGIGECRETERRLVAA